MYQYKIVAFNGDWKEKVDLNITADSEKEALDIAREMLTRDRYLINTINT